MRWVWWLIAVAAVALAFIAELRVIIAFVAAVLIFRMGMALLRMLRADAGNVTPQPAEPVTDPRERTVYWCEECGAEVLLLVRGEGNPPRHCGEGMRTRVEVPRD